MKGNLLPHPDSSLALIISAQAVHWFDLSTFYSEVKRTLKLNGVLALFGYAFVSVQGEKGEKLDEILRDVRFLQTFLLNFRFCLVLP